MSKAFQKKRDRLALIDSLIRQGGWVQEDVAVKCGVSPRTVREDFRFLRVELGAPLVSCGKNGWKYTKKWELKL